MAKILKNENESPEVDLKNLTVKLAGMGLDEEIEDVIPGKNNTKNYKTASDDSQEETDDAEKETDSEESSENVPEGESDTYAETTSENIEESVEESEEIAEFYDKRNEERDLTLEKVEELAGEMEAAGEEKKQKVGALDTIIAKTEKPQIIKEKKKAKFDAVAILGIVLAILALIGGAIYLYISTYEEPNLGVSEKDFRLHYYETAIYKGIISYGFSMPVPTYRDEDPATGESTEASATETSAAADPTAVTTEVKSKYRYYDSRMTNALDLPIYISGKEVRSNGMMKQVRFFAPVSSEEEMQVIKVAFAGFLQAFYVGTDSQICADKISNAYSQSMASAEPCVMIKDGDIAYAVSKNNIDGVPCLILDIVPAKEADKFVFFNSIFG
ncbi:MAG: hypothetical protein J5379_02100 [Clostridiales bacterium]|nr:hypothetical protein [Clostridiales bacterium]